MVVLKPCFYLNADVCGVARALLGKLLITRMDGLCTIARITETEAYNGVGDRASHAFGGRFTSRTKMMYAPGGVAYVYLCYGIHQMFNVVSGPAQNPLAVLIRAAEPTEGIENMKARRGKHLPVMLLASGPGNLCKAMGIHAAHNGLWLQQAPVYLADDGFKVPDQQISSTPRIGVGYAGTDAALPYRFLIKDNGSVSGFKRPPSPKH